METPNYSKVYRIMHWLIAVCFMLLLLTIFLRMTWMNKNNVGDIIEEFLREKKQNLSRDEIIILAKKIRKPMWNWHIYFGYALVALYSIRLLLPFFGEMKFKNPFQKNIDSKTKFQFGVYIVFYVCVAVSLISGLIIELGPKNLKESMESIHVLSIYYLLAFIVVHLGGVLMAEFTNRKGIISSVISGEKK
ncbi:cytochrome b/b6 domain-containing protein [Flavobacterium dankookense]|uniref:Cytochrome b561 n=1 Tax=Flavobacterium dankookense TaxID=706186 RepID=A0A4R6QGB2_9FLAO|nr:cytochrome b/b6 domain-containing protein [Flavobacterium dankookense]TDP61570.1 cytochrome b561 [Flavobacterium dankookense]